jgi:hypothetical protein
MSQKNLLRGRESYSGRSSAISRAFEGSQSLEFKDSNLRHSIYASLLRLCVEFSHSESELEIIASLKEPLKDIITNLFNPVRLVVDVVFVAPAASPRKVRPPSWRHKAKLDEVGGGLDVQMPQLESTPMIYNFDSVSSGLHQFDSQALGNPALSVKVLATILDQNSPPICQVSAALTVRANKRIAAALDYTIKPKALIETEIQQIEF